MLPNMSPEVIAIVSVGVALATLIVHGQRSLEARLASVDRRVARIEGVMPFLAHLTARQNQSSGSNPPRSGSSPDTSWRGLRKRA